MRRRGISAFAFVTTGTVLVVVLITKFLSGAWIAIVAMTLLWFLMRGIHNHYQHVSTSWRCAATSRPCCPPAGARHRPGLQDPQADAAGAGLRPSHPPLDLEALTVAIDPDEARALQEDWERRQIPVPLKVLDSPFREITKPVLDYVQSLRKDSPRDLVTVFIPEYVVGHWWEQLLHNQSALRLRTRLRFTSGVVVTSVPYLLASGEAAKEAADTTSLLNLLRMETVTPAEEQLAGPTRPGDA